MQRTAGRGQLVDLALDHGIIDEGRSVMRLDPGVDDQGAGAAPVLFVDKGPDSLDVGGRIGPGESYPEEVAFIPGGEFAVVHNHDQRKAVDWVSGVERPAERGDVV